MVIRCWLFLAHCSYITITGDITDSCMQWVSLLLHTIVICYLQVVNTPQIMIGLLFRMELELLESQIMPRFDHELFFDLM